MPNLFQFSDGRHVDLDASRPTVTPAQLAELKQNPDAYRVFCERINAFNRNRYHLKTQDATYKEKLQSQRKQWRKSDSGKENLAAYMRNYRARSPQAAFANNVHKCIRQALFKGWGCKSAECYIGCSIFEYREHLSAKWLPGMSWDNYGRGLGKWCIDHVKPIAFFDLSEPGQLKACFHFTNTTPIWFRENAIKWHLDKASGSVSSRSRPSSSPPSPS